MIWSIEAGASGDIEIFLVEHSPLQSWVSYSKTTPPGPSLQRQQTGKALL